MPKRILIGMGVLFACATVSFAGWVLYQGRQFERPRPLPTMAIVAAHTDAALARGEKLFLCLCADCHVPSDVETARGRVLDDFPPFVGTIRSANITADRHSGVGAWTDLQLSVLIKTGLGSDGRLRAMPPFPMIGDEDVAALVGFLRAGRGATSPDPTPIKRSELSFLGKAFAKLVLASDSPLQAGIPVPKLAPTAEYGRYAAALYQCDDCHTAGSPEHALDEAGVFGGGGEFSSPEGGKYPAPNITFAASGIAHYSLEQFKRALREGVDPGGGILRSPMVRLRFVEDDELTALFEYLKTVPKVTGGPMASAPRPHAVAGESPEAAFTHLGCVSCHGPNAPYRDRLRQAVGKPAAEVARWIRNPEVFRPGTQMPTFAAVLDEPGSVALAHWVQTHAPP